MARICRRSFDVAWSGRLERVFVVSLWNGFLGLFLIAACAVPPALCAEEELSGDTTRPETAGPEAARPDRVLVLKSGRVVKGQMRSRGNGYDIDQPAGKLFVGSGQVWLIADSLPEAHRMMRDSFQSLTPDIHMQIAEWCAGNQMWGTARRELLDALHLDPHREEARRMLANVIRRQEMASAAPKTPRSDSVNEAIDARLVMPRRSLGGLSTELAREFTRRVQPLLSNRCAQCHRPGGDREFVLHDTRRGSTPEIAEENLTSVLTQLESTTDGQDSFLEKALSQHGTMKSPPFPGRNGAQQRERLSHWVARVRQETGRALARRPDPRGPQSGIQLTGHRREQRRDAGVTHAGHQVVNTLIADSDPHAGTRSAEQVDADVLTDAQRRNRNDPFDPEIFNRRYRVRGVSTGTNSGRTYRRTP